MVYNIAATLPRRIVYPHTAELWYSIHPVVVSTILDVIWILLGLVVTCPLAFCGGSTSPWFCGNNVLTYMYMYTHTHNILLTLYSRRAAPDLDSLGEFERRLLLAKRKGKAPMPNVLNIPWVGAHTHTQVNIWHTSQCGDFCMFTDRVGAYKHFNGMYLVTDGSWRCD